jgi:hypothetical protein
MTLGRVYARFVAVLADEHVGGAKNADIGEQNFQSHGSIAKSCKVNRRKVVSGVLPPPFAL